VIEWVTLEVDDDDDDDDDDRAIFVLDGDVDTPPPDVVVVVVDVAVAVVVSEGLSLDDDAVVNARVVCSLNIPSDMYCFSRIFFRQL